MGMIIKAVILGIIEGITEFLPISSTGHLILANKFLAFEGDFANAFDIVIQSGAIFAVILYFWNKIFPPFNDSKKLVNYINRWVKVLVGIIPAAILGLGFGLDEIIENYLFYPIPVAIALIVGAVLIIISERSQKIVLVADEKDITFKYAFLVGIAQCMAFFPGMSRSASTIIGALFLGFSRSVAAEFSFFLAIPTLLGASLVKIIKLGTEFTALQWQCLMIGTLVSFVVAYFVIAFLMNYIRKHDFIVFAKYRIVLGIIVLIWSFMHL